MDQQLITAGVARSRGTAYPRFGNKKKLFLAVTSLLWIQIQ